MAARKDSRRMEINVLTRRGEDKKTFIQIGAYPKIPW